MTTLNKRKPQRFKTIKKFKNNAYINKESKILPTMINKNEYNNNGSFTSAMNNLFKNFSEFFFETFLGFRQIAIFPLLNKVLYFKILNIDIPYFIGSRVKLVSSQWVISRILDGKKKERYVNTEQKMHRQNQRTKKSEQIKQTKRKK